MVESAGAEPSARYKYWAITKTWEKNGENSFNYQR